MNRKDSPYQNQEEEVDDKQEFYKHLQFYLAMCVFFFLFNIMTTPGSLWFMYPMMGWGVGVFFHFFRAFSPAGVGPASEEVWRERQLERDLRNRRSKQKTRDLPPAQSFFDEPDLDLNEPDFDLEQRDFKQKRPMDGFDELDDIIQEKDKRRW